jgi:hypothetical protein
MEKTIDDRVGFCIINIIIKLLDFNPFLEWIEIIEKER